MTTTPDPLTPILKASSDTPFVVAQLGQSLDGRIATPTGESRWINRDAALDHLHRLRAAEGGGYIFMSDHSVSSDVSGHTYDLIVELVRKYGDYPLNLPEE